MAYHWRMNDKYCYHGNSSKESMQLCLRNYNGPYDPSALMKARDELLYHVNSSQNTAAWRRIQMKTPVNVYGLRDVDDGYGEASNMFSQAELPESKEYEEPYKDAEMDGDARNIPNKKTDAQQELVVTVTMEDDKDEINKIDTNKNMENTVRRKVYVSAKSKTFDIDNKKDGNNLLTDEQIKDAHELEESNEASLGHLKHIMDDFNHHVDTQCFKNEKTDSEEQDPKHDKEDESPYENVRREMFFKCDHCEVRCAAENDMSEHLNTAVHYSASEYKINKDEYLILTKVSVVRNLKARFKTTVMKCPDALCYSIFPEMESCVNHFNERHYRHGMRHGKKLDQYGLMDIIQEQDISIILNKPRCHQCSLTFRNLGHLSIHIEMGHFSTKLPKGKRVFLCKYCEKSFNILNGLVHLAAHKNVVKGTVVEFTVLQCANPRVCVVSASGIFFHPDVPSVGNSAKRKLKKVFSKDEPLEKCGRMMARIETCPQTCSENLNEPEQDGDVIEEVAEESDLQNSFQCDYCLEINSSKHQIISHLNEMGHKSASSVLIDGHKKVQYLKNLSSVNFPVGQHQRVYAVCSNNCHILFDTVHMNIEHLILCHYLNMDRRPYYGLTNVMEEVILKVSLNKCTVCGVNFERLKFLSAHYKSCHYPFDMKFGYDTFFRCAYCPRTFPKFKHAMTHTAHHRGFERDGMLELSVLYTDVKIKKIELSRKHSSDTERLEREIKDINQRIREMQQNSRETYDRNEKKILKKAVRALKKSLVPMFC